ncbi:MAG: UvrD-helicase domain-containing protein [Planctomycetaceae bacterium]
MPLDLRTDDFPHGLVVEASAGTGKTYSVAAIVTLEIALCDDLRIGDILITTFTRNAAAELRDRVRRRLAETAEKLRAQGDPGDDPVVARLLDGAGAEIAARIRRLERALVEFDTATITTIHGVCSRVLRMAGMEAGSITDGDETDRILTEAVNDLVVAHATAAHRWTEDRIKPLVDALRSDPFVEAWIDPALDAPASALLETLAPHLESCVKRVQRALTAAPGYHDLLRIARELVCDASRADLLAALRRRFALAIVDEAQDTDRQQWEFFERLFPGGDGRRLISVGDPKQAIYGFRGADVRAYVAHVASPETVRRSLTVNYRSDQPVLDELNAAFAGATFGAGIAYQPVHATAHHQAALIQRMPGSVEFVDLGIAGSQMALARPVLGKVIELLDDARLAQPADPVNPDRPIAPKDICILVRSGSVGQIVQQALGRAGIPAVTAGTASVMASSMALDIRALLEAMERPSDLGRVRRAAATVFFGHSLAEVGALLDDTSAELQAVQDRLLEFSALLVKKGIAALGATVEADVAVMTRIAQGRHGERNVTDFLHVIEVMDSAGPGQGCSAERALAIFSRLANMDEKHDLVARRVESDADAVRISTIHAAKGLEFPGVIVADLWKDPEGRGERKPITFYDDDGVRKLDLGFALGVESSHAKQRRKAADVEESQRLLYVATTRAQHYLAVLVGRGRPPKKGPTPLSILERTITLPASSAPNGRTRLSRPLTPQAGADEDLALAPPPAVEQTYRRMSFTGLTAGRGHGRERLFDPEGGGYDEADATSGAAPPALPESAGASRAVIDLPAGVAVGRVIHEIFEHVDTSRRPLDAEVRRVVAERATSGRLKDRHDDLVKVVTATLETPLGGPFGDLALGSIPPSDRLSELTFEMGLASLVEGVRAQAIGELLADTLDESDSLHGYAALLAGPAFDVPVGGLLTGSIDALVRLPGSGPDRPRLLIADYKSNKLHRGGMEDPLRAYAPDRLVPAMAEHHYPLQALLYGTAVSRMLRWRLPAVDPDDCIAGVAYAFIRGMQGPDTPTDDKGHRYGVFAWQAPRGLWKKLSDLLVAQPAGAGR